MRISSCSLQVRHVDHQQAATVMLTRRATIAIAYRRAPVPWQARAKHTHFQINQLGATPTAYITMVISNHIKSQYFINDEQVIRLSPPLIAQPDTETRRMGTPWTPEEHDLFLEALEKHPSGPWKLIAAHIGTRTTRQTMTHAQRYREKIARRKRTLTPAGLATLRSTAETTTTSNPPRPNGKSSSDATETDFDLLDDETELSFVDFSTFSLDSDVEDVESERLLLSVIDSYVPLPFSDEEARSMIENFTSDAST